MKRYLLILFLFVASIAGATNYYLSPSGNDATGDGSIGNPWWRMSKPWTVITPGDTVFMRGGTYAYTDQSDCYLIGKDGSSGNMIVIMSYPGETATITKGPGYTNNDEHWRGGVYLDGDYIKMYKLVFTGFEHGGDPVTGFIWRGLYMANCNFCVIEQCISHDNEYGFNLEDNSKGNLFLNCDAYNNWDINTGGGNADGFGWGYLTVNDAANPNVARGCRSWWNGDDGFDGWHGEQIGGIVKLDSCWSWYNGYYKGTFNSAGNGEGFKLGGGSGGSPGVMLRYYLNCLSFHNRNKGFDQNSLYGNATLYNCTVAYNGNHGININQNSSAHVVKNCVAYNNNGTQLFLNTESEAVSSNNSTNDGSSGSVNDVTDADFVDVDSSSAAHTQLSGARQSNGTLPVITFLHLASGSSLIDAGTDVGIAYGGAAPDKGAFEYGTVDNYPPTADAEPESQSITLPTNSANLTGSGSDPDGSITGYAWSKVSGPATYTINSPTSQNTTVSNLVEGTYVFRLTVTDNDGATGTDDVTVIVNPAAGGGSNSNTIKLRYIIHY